MIRSVTITNDLAESVVLELRSPEQSGFFIRGIEGLGPAKAVINTRESLSSDGAFYNSARLNARNIVFNLGFLENLTIEETRQSSYKYFPIKKRIEILIETDRRFGKAFGYVESNEPDIFSNDEGSVVSVLCPDPYFYSLETFEVDFSSVVGGFTFPFSNESLTQKLIEFGNILTTTEKNIIIKNTEY